VFSYAQQHYPFAPDSDRFLTERFPADFVAEGIDQTRGWFYTMLVLGTALFDKAPFKNIVRFSFFYFLLRNRLS
jgi:isoleucyl-tRNA synthetase